MNPAWSVIFLTTLIGAAQGLFIALVGTQWAALSGAPAAPALWRVGGVVALLLAAGGLAASFFHLGRPERFWRTAAMWRTSWLSREVIALPAFMALAALWTAHWLRHADGEMGLSPWVGAAGVVAALVLFVCTAMVYASVKMLQEWASGYTLLNYTLMGLGSGLTLGAALAAAVAPAWAPRLAVWALALTLAALAGRALSLRRNARLKPRSTLQTAIGVRHPHITQRAQGFGGGSFNTREFFHGRAPGTLARIKGVFLLLAFVLPAALLAAGWPAAAFAVQFVGLLAERWFFFAQANHPQNLYYQAVS